MAEVNHLLYDRWLLVVNAANREKIVNHLHANVGDLIAKIDDPDVDIDYYEQQLKNMTAEVKGKFTNDDDDAAKLKTLISYLFEENGYHGSRQDYYNKANSYMNRVLDDREGLPITLSTSVRGRGCTAVMSLSRGR